MDCTLLSRLCHMQRLNMQLEINQKPYTSKRKQSPSPSRKRGPI